MAANSRDGGLIFKCADIAVAYSIMGENTGNPIKRNRHLPGHGFSIIFLSFFGKQLPFHPGNGIFRSIIFTLRNISRQQGGQRTTGATVSGHVLAIFPIILCFLLKHREKIGFFSIRNLYVQLRIRKMMKRTRCLQIFISFCIFLPDKGHGRDEQ